MTMRSLLAGAAIALAASITAMSANATEYLTNGGFDSGNTSGWLLTGNTSFFGANCNGAAQAGSCYVEAGPIGSDGILSQTFSDTAGEMLNISGWMAGNGAGFSHVQFFFNSDLIFDSGNPLSNSGWVNQTATAVATGSDTFSVHFRDDPSYVHLDSFSVSSAVAGVPEPASWALMLTGFLGLGGALRSARRRIAVVA
jgi:hypothetical protein